MDTFAWTLELRCPPIICNDSVKKTLHSGPAGHLWDEISDIIFATERVKTIQKNILLYHLKMGTSNKIIDCIRNILQMKLDRVNLKCQIVKLEHQYNQQELIVAQKAQKLQEISSKRHKVRTRRDLLKLKSNQTSTQICESNDMRSVCQHLKPSTSKDLDPRILMNMSNVAVSLWTGANKRQVFDTVSNSLSCIEVSTLWSNFYQSLSHDVDALIKAETMEPIETDKKNINIGTARIYGQHICMVSKKLLYDSKTNNHQQNVLEFIERIEATSNNSTEISEWLPLALEVQKLETEQRCLQAEVDKIRDDLHEHDTFEFDLAELVSEIENIDAEIAKYIQDIQQSLNLLKCAPMLIMNIREKINLELQKIIELRANGYDSKALNNDLKLELDIFDDFNVNALRKITLKGDTEVYRHTESCFSEAFTSVTNLQNSISTSYFPLTQAPIYFLVECYKNIISMLILKKFRPLETEDNLNLLQLPVQTYEENNYNTLELLNLSKVVNTRTRAEIGGFNEILNMWVTQAVQKVIEIVEKTIDDATFSEWIQRYKLLLYMFQNLHSIT